MLDKIINFLKNNLLQKERMILIFLAGILLFVISIPTKKESTKLKKIEEKSEKETDEKEYVKGLEEELKGVLEQIDGVGRVDVMLTLKNTGEKVLAYNQPSYSTTKSDEQDSQGGSRSVEEKEIQKEIIFDKNGTNEETPYVIIENKPQVEGVLIVAEGGGDEVIQISITDAVQALFGVEPHKIKIIKMKK